VAWGINNMKPFHLSKLGIIQSPYTTCTNYYEQSIRYGLTALWTMDLPKVKQIITEFNVFKASPRQPGARIILGALPA
jgi:hypothetical protein